MSLINVNNLSFCYEGNYDNVFENVSFNIDTNWKLGFSGRNGRGKTTFLKLLMGEYEYQGKISANVSFEYFPYEVKDKTLNTIEVIKGDYEFWQLQCELSLLNVNEDVLYRPFYTLSSGEQTKVLLASMFLNENNFLLIDEPTNHLDMESRDLLAEYLSGKNGFILVSHDRAFLDKCTDHTLSINKTDIEVIKGNFSVWYENKILRDNFEIQENEKLSKDIKRLKKTAAEKAEWSDKAESRKIGFDPRKVEKSVDRRPKEAAKAKKSMARAKAIEKRNEKLIEEKESLLKNIEESENLKLYPEPFHSKRLIEAKNLCICYDDKKVFENLSFEILSGERVRLEGSNGSGKSSLLKLIMNEEINFKGSFYKATGLKISYIPQITDNLKGSLKDYEEKNGLNSPLFRAILRKLDFSRVQFEKNLESYSMGQKKKVLIAHSLSEKANLYIWDEPLNYIDVLSRIQLEELIKKYQPTILFVEHDKAFCENIATKIIKL